MLFIGTGYRSQITSNNLLFGFLFYKAGEAHESHGQNTRGNKSDWNIFKTFGNIRVFNPLSYSRKNNNSQAKAKPAAESE